MVEPDNPNSPQWVAERPSDAWSAPQELSLREFKTLQSAVATAEAPPEFLKTASETALETAPLSQLALNLLPWFSFVGDDLNSTFWPFRTMKNHLAKFRKVAFHLAKFGPFIFPLAKFPLFLHARTTDFPYICSLLFSHVNSFCNLVFSRHKALSCNFAIYRGAQHLQMGWLGDRSSVH